MQTPSSGIGLIFATLAKCSTRPRYAFLVLQLVTEVSDARGRAGPLVQDGNKRPQLLRDWLCTQLLPLSARDGRRSALRVRVTESLRDKMMGDAAKDAALIESAVEEQVYAAGRANVSRAITDLVNAGFLSRHYAGYATNHANRGGGRHAVYVVERRILAALGRAEAYMTQAPERAAGQGQLFAV